MSAQVKPLSSGELKRKVAEIQRLSSATNCAERKQQLLRSVCAENAMRVVFSLASLDAVCYLAGIDELGLMDHLLANLTLDVEPLSPVRLEHAMQSDAEALVSLIDAYYGMLDVSHTTSTIISTSLHGVEDLA